MPDTAAVFLDRDGTLIEDVHYCKDPDLVRPLPGAIDSLRRLKAAGYRTVIITNQSAIGRGWMTHEQYVAVHNRTLELIGPELIDAAYFCADSPDLDSQHRKPAPGMVLDAARDHGIGLTRSWMVGDKPIDVQCGRAAGTRSILVLTGRGSRNDGEDADFVANDLAEAVDFILKHSDASQC
ncbi:MAG TPA: HAD-IIIA family hydrolase [Chthoniobacteraceae bacterium]|jgi:D-glycero-D-manno-heptose 1,7-bisphosphate phosphatase|nr:HAD-IIIA family hydrolase [Chthoniobacteraceae bacterium]